jgi:hypothetical protein
MRSARKNLRILSALSMAAAGTLVAKTAHGVTLTMYYGNDPSYSHSNNAIIVGTGLQPTSEALFSNAAGGIEYFNNATNVPAGSAFPGTGIFAPVSSTIGGNGIQTITMPIGDYLSLAIDALLTGNANADAGVNSGTGTKPSNHQVQPSYLGLSQLDIAVASSDTQGDILSPITFSPTPDIGNPSAGYTGTVYYSTANLNTSGAGQNAGSHEELGANGGTSGGAYNIVPAWGSVHLAGGVEPNNAPGGWNAAGGDEPTMDSGPNASGNVGIDEDPSGGSTSSVLAASNTPAGVHQVEDFAAGTAAANATPSYSNATDFIDSLIYQGLGYGLVTLSPTVNAAGTAYWTRTGAGSLTTRTTYGPQAFNVATDTINNVPMLVIDVFNGLNPAGSPGHAILALAPTPAANANYPFVVTGTFSPATNAGNGQITITGGGGSYVAGQVTAINGGAGDVEANVGVTGWNPATDPEFFGIQVDVNGSLATTTQLATLIAAIDGDGDVPASFGATASTTDPTHGDLSGLDTATTTYNLFLTFAGGGPGASDDLGLDLSNSNDLNLTGYTFTAVSVVPEPMSLSLLTLGGVGLMARRNRRNS